MSIIPQQENINSVAATTNTIKTDQQVYRWFTFLISQPAVKSRLSLTKETCQRYKEFKAIVLKQGLLHILFGGGILFIIFLQNYYIFLSIIFLLYPCLKLHSQKKQCVAEISRELISQDFDDMTLRQTTLYQIGEKYSKKYNIPSLVDTIYHLDKILRYAVFLIGIVLIFIWPIYTTLQRCLAFFVAYQMVNAAAQTTVIYRNLK